MWGGKCARIKSCVLQQPTKVGGVTVPKMMLYYHAAMLALEQWWNQGNKDCWVIKQVEIPTPLSDLMLLDRTSCQF